MKLAVFTLAMVAALTCVAAAQEVVINGFPLGVGLSVDPAFWEPHYAELARFADVLGTNPEARAVIVGRADGTRYRAGNDAKNPGLALGRAHALRNVLVSRFGVDSTRLVIQSSDVLVPGGEYRSVCARIEMSPRPVVVEQPPPAPVVMQEPPAVQPAPVEYVENNTFNDQMTIRLGFGASSTPFGALPMVTGAVIWRQTVALNMVLGHTFWNDSYQFQGAKLETWNRMVGGGITVYPWRDKPVGFVGGWMRVEEIAQSYYEYVRLSEGPVLGVSVTPLKHVSLSGLYNPARQRVEGTDFSSAKNGQFLLGVSVFTDFGGGR
jgi:hypothetical protein